MINEDNVRENHGVRSSPRREGGTYEGSIIAFERDGFVSVAIGSQVIQTEPEAALRLATMLRRCASRVIARRRA